MIKEEGAQTHGHPLLTWPPGAAGRKEQPGGRAFSGWRVSPLGTCSAFRGSPWSPQGGLGEGREDGLSPTHPSLQAQTRAGQGARVAVPPPPRLAWRCFSHASISKALHVSMALSRWAFGGDTCHLAGAMGSGSTCPAGLKLGLLDSKLSHSACGSSALLRMGQLESSLDSASRQTRGREIVASLGRSQIPLFW